jgi:energy-coupling factor transporter ATP-binding protein EcfA2
MSLSPKARWLRDLLRFLPLKSQFVLSGNVYDFQVWTADSGTPALLPLMHTLAAELRRHNGARTLAYNSVEGFRALSSGDGPDASGGNALLQSLGLTPTGGRASGGLDLLESVLDRVVASDGDPIALILDFASRLTISSERLSDAEHRLFRHALVISHRARPRPVGPERRAAYNTLIWVVDREGDLPDWLLVGNPRIRHIPVARPDHRARQVLAPLLLRSLPGAPEAGEAALRESARTFVEETEGLLLLDLKSIVDLARAEGVPLPAIADAVRRYKVGVAEDPWRNLDRERIRGGDEFIRARVKGQDHAVTHVLDIVKRAVTGVGPMRRGGRPRGVVFLAGPTGVGKTELAKTLTHLLFGDERAYIRFDMSEFSAEHSDQRLIGAPPGYVGYDAGGELTNAVRERPFSVVLFDEIEKAHPRILDKFLQVLDEGVLTSGRGERVYFSETFICFTSNLGIYRVDSTGERVPNVTPSDGFPTVRARVRAEIERHFKLALNRPEILNRIGDNLIVFDFIRPAVASEILELMVRGVLDGVHEQGISITLGARAREVLTQVCVEDLANGGRGIRNKLELHLVNPLARALFDADATSGDAFEITEVVPGEVTQLTLTPNQGTSL